MPAPSNSHPICCPSSLLYCQFQCLTQCDSSLKLHNSKKTLVRSQQSCSVDRAQPTSLVQERRPPEHQAPPSLPSYGGIPEQTLEPGGARERSLWAADIFK